MRWVEYNGQIFNLANVTNFAYGTERLDPKHLIAYFNCSDGFWAPEEAALTRKISLGEFASKELAMAEVRDILAGKYDIKRVIEDN